MSLFESTVVIFCVMLYVSSVSSHMFTVPDEVTAVEEYVKVNNLYYNTIPAFVERGNKDNYEGSQKNGREKRNTNQDSSNNEASGNLANAAQLPWSRLLRLTTLLFRNMFSTEPVDGDPPLNPPEAAKNIAMMLQKGLDMIKSKKKTDQNPKS